MRRGDGYDDIRRAYNAGAAAAVSCALGTGPNRKAPNADDYVERLKSEPLTATLK